MPADSRVDRHGPTAVGQVIAPQGHLDLIEGATALTAFDAGQMFAKSVGIPLELMFTRAKFAAADRIVQHRLLADVAAVVDQRVIRTSFGVVVGPIDAKHLREATVRCRPVIKRSAASNIAEATISLGIAATQF